MAVIPLSSGTWAYPISYKVSQWVNMSQVLFFSKVWWILHSLHCEAMEPTRAYFHEFSCSSPGFRIVFEPLPDASRCSSNPVYDTWPYESKKSSGPRVSACLSQLKLQSVVWQMQSLFAKCRRKRMYLQMGWERSNFPIDTWWPVGELHSGIAMGTLFSDLEWLLSK